MFARAKSLLLPPWPYQRVLLLGLAIGFGGNCGVAFAQSSGTPSSAAIRALQSRMPGAPGNPATANMTPQQQALALKQYDLNRDGQVDAQETLIAQKRGMGGRGRSRGGNNGTGGPGMGPQIIGPNMQQNGQPFVDPLDAPAAAAPAQKPAKVAPKKPAKPSLVERFDADGDGKLNAEEKAAARAAIAKRQKTS